MFKKTALLGAMLSLFSANAMAISVTTTNDAETLANNILGSGISIVGGSASYSGFDQSGTFTGDTVFDIGEGIVLTTGSAQDAADDTNNSDGTTVNTAEGGDADLDALVAPYNTQDAAVLEFEFTTDGGDLYFNWAFASEEYNEFVNSIFNDAFAFFVDGVNIALAPDGQVATINSINCGNPYDSLQVIDNCSSFNNNDPSDSTSPFATEYDGFTDVFTAEFLGLGAGTHSIKIAIADTSDGQLDSAVFIQAGSFSDQPTNSVPEPGVLALLGLGLAGMTFTRRRKLN